jgi:hypothetical protein
MFSAWRPVYGAVLKNKAAGRELVTETWIDTAAGAA